MRMLGETGFELMSISAACNAFMYLVVLWVFAKQHVTKWKKMFVSEFYILYNTERHTHEHASQLLHLIIE